MNTNQMDSFKQYKHFAIRAAKELYYPDTVIARLHTATTDCEIRHIMKSAREEAICEDE